MTRRNRPQIIIEFFLRLISGFEESETVLGDLEEAYAYRKETNGRTNATLWYFRQIAKIFLKTFFLRLQWSYNMLKNYVVLTLRILKRSKFHSIINLAGLALGMATFILLMLWIQDELSFDNFHVNKDNIYRVITEQNNSGQIHKSVASPITLGEKLKNDYPEIINFTIAGAIRYSIQITYNGKVLGENVGICASPFFFEIFSFKFLLGDPETALKDPNSIVLTEELAKKIFGSEDPLGKELLVFTRNVIVTGVIENVPKNSHLYFDHIQPHRFWGNPANARTYILLEEGSDEDAVSVKIRNVLNKTENRDNIQISLQPLSEIHLYSKDFVDDIYHNKKGDITYVYIFSFSALCVLLIACINFTNLSSARFSSRIKEIGLRKVVGAYRADIIRQFFGESILFSYAAFFIAVLMVFLFLPEFNNLSSKQLSFGLLINHKILPMLILIPLLTGFTSGSYPAVLISSLKPVNVFKESSIFKTNSSLIIRKILVVIQFVFAITIIIVTIISYNQLSYMRNRYLGFNKNNVISFGMHSYWPNKNAIKNEFLKNPNVLYVSVGFSPEMHFTGETNVDWEGKNSDVQLALYKVYVETDFLKVLDLEMVEGRFFSEDFPSDSSNFVINETAVKAMGLTSPIGKRFKYRNREGRIIGVIKDYNHESLHHRIKPAFFFKVPRYPFINVKIAPGNVKETITYLESVWKKFEGNSLPFTYYFLDEVLDNLYSSEKRTCAILRYFTGLIIFISCLGLFGLASITAVQRKKEIAIRKVLGASVINVNIMLTKDFLKLIVLSAFISWPAAWFIINKWLESFAYKVPVNAGPFVLAGILAVVISLFSVIFQSAKAANSNLVETIRFN